VIFLFDANMPVVLARALNDFGKEVLHVQDIRELGRRAPDPLILQYAGERGMVVVSKDLAMAGEPWFQPELRRLGAGIVFIRSGSKREQKQLWGLAQQVVRGWDGVEAYAARTARPFTAILKSRGGVARY
jgi:predicted nuclease of predicted toxin-antitoxin system